MIDKSKSLCLYGMGILCVKEEIKVIRLNNGKYVIGFDNGYQFGKTANFMFDNGVYPLGKVEPSLREHSLKFERKY